MAGITGKLVVRPEEVSSFDRKENKKMTTSISALSREVEGDDIWRERICQATHRRGRLTSCAQQW